MIVKETGRSFEAHPEYTGRAVCVDITPLKVMPSAFGDRHCFRLVFETDLLRDDGSHWAVWSQPFTASLHEKAALRKSLRQWMGRDLTPAELSGFDLETLIGRPASIVVIHEAGDEGQTFDRIAACTPHRNGEPLTPSGRYVRVKDRPPRDGAGGSAAPRPPLPTQNRPAPVTVPATPQAPATPVAEDDITRHAAVVVHVGRNRGRRFEELSDTEVDALATHWLPTVQANPNASPADHALVGAVQWVLRSRTNPDDVPF